VSAPIRTSMQNELIQKFENIVGQKRVLTKENETSYYRTGFMTGIGSALAVVFPQTLLEQWKLIEACVKANCIIIMQAAKTGVTGGSTPNGYDYDRDLVVINTLDINKIHLINDGKQAVSLSGATLHSLEVELDKIHRTPHSVIGSSQVGATVVGGIANNSGGALVKRGPAYTQLALYAQVDKDGKLHLVNHLGIEGLGDTPEEILNNLENGNFDEGKLKDNINCLNERQENTNITSEFRKVWTTLSGNFLSNEKEVFEGFKGFVEKHVGSLTVEEFQEVMAVLGELKEGFDQQPYVKNYIEKKLEQPVVRSLGSLKSLTSNEDLLEKISELENKKIRNHSIIGILKKLHTVRGWNSDEQDFLAEVTVDQIYEVLLSETDDNLIEQVRTALSMFYVRKEGNEGKRHPFGENLVAALVRLSERSSLDRYRISRFLNMELPVLESEEE